jgi:hypothetical protein
MRCGLPREEVGNLSTVVTLYRLPSGELALDEAPAAEALTVKVPPGFQFQRESTGALRVAAPHVSMSIDVAIDAGVIELDEDPD